MPIALALDTSSSRTGYVRGPTDGSGPLTISSFSVNKKCRGDVGAQIHNFREQLIPRMKGVEIVLLERPVLPFGKLNYDTLRVLYGIAGIVEVLAIDYDIPCYDVQNGKHKKLIYGKGGAKPTNTVELAGAWGFECENDDEADACGVFLYATQKMYEEDFKHWETIKVQSPLVPFMAKEKKKKPQKFKPVAGSDSLL